MNLQEAYNITIKKELTEQESLDLVKFYIKTLKNKNIEAKIPSTYITNSPASMFIYRREMEYLLRMAHYARIFIKALYEEPENITVKTYG